MLTNQFTTDNADEKQTDTEKAADFQEARQFFTRNEDFNALSAATECIYPKDDNGPGAVELGVPYFIDKQMAGSWGTNARDYRHAPFIKFQQVESMKGKSEEQSPTNPPYVVKHSETELQRHQARLTRGEIFIEGLRKLNQESQKRFSAPFYEAEEEQQIEILKDMESGNIKLKGVAAENFFILLRRMTLEGAFSDPLYGGNRNLAGWKMKEFPGAQASYANIIEKDEFVKMKPVSLTNYQGH
ncbi:Gluconate 2-dehydrogenase (acceptor) [Lentibacillus sp. JNUCC-1]|uniref:gluconate 2-dehydrogenase subunit 3 family protein n=1 Tax=Lentibacillus sp. JNUCC-1 TaxID=2654513 RepID=UPI001323616F|nr:gluconate 2-dehydrogenase subunit 3 family protein [Lentibacillus sp. JNUCC-1]MUV38225.1 Gluconate 2-dehydrogenase (acceptor) [Lentibacillus sp. JNUCC-1]